MMSEMSKMERPPVVCLCGPERFDEVRDYQTQILTEYGHIVLGAEPLRKGRFGEKQLQRELYKRMIDLADWMFVIDVDGYRDEETLQLVAYAVYKDKPVEWFSRPGEWVWRHKFFSHARLVEQQPEEDLYESLPLVQDRNTEYSLGDLLAVPAAGGVQIFAGALACRNLAGCAVPAADRAGLVFIGVATERIDNRDGKDGDKSVVVRRRGRYRYNCHTKLDQGALCSIVYVWNDQTVIAYGRECEEEVEVGVIDRVEGPHDCWVAIDSAVLFGAYLT